MLIATDYARKMALDMRMIDPVSYTHLYEKKLITYPRTGSRYIPEDVFAEIPKLDHLDDPFAAHAACRLAAFGGRVHLDDDLSNAVAVAQVDEGHGAEVPHFLHPSGEGDGLVYVFGSQAAARYP